MKSLHLHTLDPVACRAEWGELRSLLDNNESLDERSVVLPFFRARTNLSLITAYYFPRFLKPDRFAREFQIYGDFVADLVVGSADSTQYLLVEFEKGANDSVFRRGKKSTPVWAPRFEAAYSQVVDWLWKLEDMRSTADFQHTFGSRRASFHGLIIIGKGMNLAPQEEDRLRWRLDRTVIDSTAISCVSFDQLALDIDHWLTRFHGV